MAPRIVLAALCLMTLLPARFRVLAARPSPRAPCTPVGLGAPPRHWIGCLGDPGPRRDLSGQERILAGVPIDLNAATPEDLAGIPGLSARLAIEVVRERAANGPFDTVDDLIRVRGIGPGRLTRARAFLSTRR